MHNDKIMLLIRNYQCYEVKTIGNELKRIYHVRFKYLTTYKQLTIYFRGWYQMTFTRLREIVN